MAWYIESKSASFTGSDVDPELFADLSVITLLTDNNRHIGTFSGINAAAIVTYDYLHLGPVAASGLDVSDFTLHWNPYLGAPLENASLFILGDIDRDTYIDASDTGVVFENWGTDMVASDLNGDGIVDAADAGIQFANWSTSVLSGEMFEESKNVSGPLVSVTRTDWPLWDLNLDEVVDAADAAELFFLWGRPDGGHYG